MAVFSRIFFVLRAHPPGELPAPPELSSRPRFRHPALSERPVPYTQVNGVRLHVQELGAPGRHPTAVLLHGLLVDNLSSWYFTAAPRLARERRVVLYDLRGHGKSERAPAGYDTASLAADLGRLVAGLDAGPVDLVGHSYGALVALRYAREHPEHVRRLALVEAPLPPSRFGELEAWLDAEPEQLLAALPEGLRAGIESGGRRARRALAALGFLLGESSLVADLKAEADVPDAELARLALPVLLVYGRSSSCRGVGERLERALPDARRVELDGGHYLHLERPAELAASLEAFLDG